MKGVLLQNFGWKVLSLAIAVALWYAVVGEPRYGAAASAPLLFSNIPPDLEISSDRPEKVSLELLGTPGQLDQEHLASVAVILDLGPVTQPGERTFNLTASSVRLPRGVRFVRAVPSQIRLYFERRRTAEVPIRARFVNSGASGYSLRRHAIEPARLQITGPESHVARVAFAETDVIDLAGVIGEKVFHVSAFVDDPQVRFESPPRVAVQVETAKIPVVGDR